MKSLVEYIDENLILEHFVNAKNKEEMEKYKDVVWDILQSAYKDIGGLAGMDNADQLIKDSDFWKMVRKNGKIVAVRCYTFKRGGRKSCYSGSDGTKEGKDAVKGMIKDDIRLTDREFWAECSGAMEHIYLKYGAIPVPAEMAQKIMADKKFEKIDDDGLHYERKIGDKVHKKLLVTNKLGEKNFKNIAKKNPDKLPEIAKDIIEEEDIKL